LTTEESINSESNEDTTNVSNDEAITETDEVDPKAEKQTDEPTGEVGEGA
jgi:hypothetical protein